MQKATARWTGSKVKFEINSASGHTIVADEPPQFGDDEGMRPTEMVLGALGACTGINVVLLLRKYRQPCRSLEVDVEGDQMEEWPHAFTKIRINFRIGWDGKHDKQVVADVLDQAVNKYCPVDATLVHGAKVEYRKSDA